MANHLPRLIAKFLLAVFLMAFAAPQLGTPTVQAKDGTGLDKITWSGTIRVEQQSHHTDPADSSDPHHTHTFTSDQSHVTDYQVQGLPHDALNQWDSSDVSRTGSLP